MNNTNQIIQIMAKHDIVMGSEQDIICDSEIHRFNLKNEQNGKKSGWYVVNGNFLNFGSWKGEKYSVKLKPNEVFLAVNKVEQYRNRKLIEKNRKQAQRVAAGVASSIWHSSRECVGHQYLRNKDVCSYGLRIENNNLIVPILDNHNQIKSLHFISPLGNKWFLKDGQIKGNYFLINIASYSNKIIICEGYSTGASLMEATKLPTVIAFNAGNLLDVARNIRARYPNKEIIIAADNDSQNEINTGVTKGKEAAKAVSGKLVYPQFIGTDQGTDFNDYYCLYGIHTLQNSFHAKGVI